MEKKITICDCCGKEGQTEKLTAIAYRTNSFSDGAAFDKPLVVATTLDLCEDCALKATNLHSVGVMSDEYRIENHGVRLLKDKILDFTMSEISRLEHKQEFSEENNAIIDAEINGSIDALRAVQKLIKDFK